MKIAPLVAASALAFSAFNASAVTNWAVHAPFEFGSGSAVGAGSSLLDEFSFTLTAAADVTATAVANNLGPLMLTGALVDLFQGPVGLGTSVGLFAFNSTPTSHTFTSLAAGSYYYVVSGTVGPRSAAGSYTLTSQLAPASPIPEPGIYAMMLAGLAVAAVLVRRRNAG